MNKIKVAKNDSVMAFDFNTNLLEQDKMHKLCEIFKLNEIYIDIYGASKSFTETILKKKTDIIVAQISNSYGIAIKTNINNVPMIAEVLSIFDFDDMNIWDCYISWDKYLQDKNTKIPFFTFKKIKYENGSKFYLNYNPKEGHEVEIICDKGCSYEKLTERIQKLI